MPQRTIRIETIIAPIYHTPDTNCRGSGKGSVSHHNKPANGPTISASRAGKPISNINKRLISQLAGSQEALVGSI